MAKLLLAHARSNEIGQTAGGKAGDQTGREVLVESFFEYHWEVVLRPKRKEVADGLASNGVLVCENDVIGYDQPDRYSMYLEAKKLNYNFEKITKPCNTDCSQLMATLIIAQGIKVSPYIYTGNMVDAITATGEFEKIPYTSSKELRKGDIVVAVTNRHTAVIVESPNDDPVWSKEPKWVVEVYGIGDLYVRSAPSEEAKPIKEWPVLGLGNLVDVCDATVVGPEPKDIWLYVRIAGQYYGWIQQLYTLRKTPNRTGIVSTDLYLRTAPGTNNKALMVMKQGETVYICDEKPASNGALWYYVIYKNIYGFCSKKYVKNVVEK